MFSLRILKISQYHDVRKHLRFDVCVRVLRGLRRFCTYLLPLVIYGWNQSSSIRCRFVDWRQKKKFQSKCFSCFYREFRDALKHLWTILYMHCMKTNKIWVNSSRSTSCGWGLFSLHWRDYQLKRYPNSEWWMPDGINSLVSVSFHLVQLDFLWNNKWIQGN